MFERPGGVAEGPIDPIPPVPFPWELNADPPSTHRHSQYVQPAGFDLRFAPARVVGLPDRKQPIGSTQRTRISLTRISRNRIMISLTRIPRTHSAASESACGRLGTPGSTPGPPRRPRSSFGQPRLGQISTRTNLDPDKRSTPVCLPAVPGRPRPAAWLRLTAAGPLRPSRSIRLESPRTSATDLRHGLHPPRAPTETGSDGNGLRRKRAPTEGTSPATDLRRFPSEPEPQRPRRRAYRPPVTRRKAAGPV